MKFSGSAGGSRGVGGDLAIGFLMNTGMGSLEKQLDPLFSTSYFSVISEKSVNLSSG